MVDEGASPARWDTRLSLLNNRAERARGWRKRVRVAAGWWVFKSTMEAIYPRPSRSSSPLVLLGRFVCLDSGGSEFALLIS